MYKFKSVAMLKDMNFFYKKINCNNKHDAPYCKTNVKPASILFPTFGRNSVRVQQDISLTKLYRLPSVDESISRRMFGKMHGNRVDLGLFRIIARSDGANLKGSEIIVVLKENPNSRATYRR
jgi:hypothetical protein